MRRYRDGRCESGLGLFRDRYAGSLFGDSLALSAFYSAFQLPNLARNLFGEGALSLAFVPAMLLAGAIAGAGRGIFASRVLSRLAVLLLLVVLSYGAAVRSALFCRRTLANGCGFGAADVAVPVVRVCQRATRRVY